MLYPLSYEGGDAAYGPGWGATTGAIVSARPTPGPIPLPTHAAPMPQPAPVGNSGDRAAYRLGDWTHEHPQGDPARRPHRGDPQP